jgi:WD40 repeat protein
MSRASVDVREQSRADQRLREIVQDCVRKCAAGETLDERALVDSHPELAPQLAEELAILRRIEQACQTAAAEDHKSPVSPGLEVRCPECHHPLPLEGAGELAKLTCPICSTRFSLLDGGDAASAAAPKKIGRFELIEQLGAGGFGVVWEARDTALDRTVAIKIPRTGQLTAAEAEQFFREARTAAQLQHPNIVAVHEVGRDGNLMFIVSDLVDGVALSEWVQLRPPTQREAAELCKRLALALHHAHEAGIVHRDLKPQNVLIDSVGEPHITDFGLARRDAGEATVTLDGQLVGTPAYMSPEQMQGDAHRCDRRSDVYSLGVVLFQLLTGDVPFRGSASMLAHQIVCDEPPSPRKLNATVPRDLETITLVCLEKDPARRYATAKELADDLRRFLHGEPLVARPVGRIERTWRWCRRNPRLAGLSAAVAALLLMVAGMTTYSSIQSRSAAREARWQQYLSDMHVAMQAWDDADLAKAAEMLERHRQPAPDEDLRGFEWYYLWRHVQAAMSAPGFKLDSPAWSVAVSHSGQLLATGSDDGELVLWRLPNLTRLLTLEGHRFRVQAIAFAPDDKLLSTAGGDGTARIWDVTTGRLLHTLRGHSADIHAVAFSPDGRLLATAGSDRTTKLWDVASGAELRTLRGHTDKIGSVAWRDGGAVITGSGDQTVREWNVADGSQVRVLAKLAVNTFKLALSPNRSVLATGATDGAIRLLDARTGNLLQTFPGHRGRVRAVTFSADGQTVVSAGDDRRALIWDVASGQLLRTITAHSTALTSLAFTPDGGRLITASQDGSVNLSEIASRSSGEDLVCRGHEDFVLNVAFDTQGQRLASASADGTVRVWNAARGELELVLTHPPALVAAASSSPNVHWMASVVWCSRDSTVIGSGNDGCLYAWNAANGDLLWTVAAHSTWAYSLDCSPDGKVVASCGIDDKVVRLWRATDGAALGSFSLEQAGGNCVKFSPNGRLLACGDQEGRLVLVEAATGRQQPVLAGHKGGIASLAFSHNGSMVATGGGPPGAILWELSSGRQVHALPHGEHVNGVAFSPDGRVVATAGSDNRVRLWDVATGAERVVLEGHIAWVESVAFSPDGTIIASASDDRTVRLWRAASRAEAEAPAAR